MHGYCAVLKAAKINLAKRWCFVEGRQDRSGWVVKNGCFWGRWVRANMHGYCVVLKDAKLKAAKRWGFPEGRQDRFLQIVQNIGFSLKAAKIRARPLAVRAGEEVSS